MTTISGKRMTINTGKHMAIYNPHSHLLLPQPHRQILILPAELLQVHPQGVMATKLRLLLHRHARLHAPQLFLQPVVLLDHIRNQRLQRPRILHFRSSKLQLIRSLRQRLGELTILGKLRCELLFQRRLLPRLVSQPARRILHLRRQLRQLRVFGGQGLFEVGALVLELPDLIPEL